MDKQEVKQLLEGGFKKFRKEINDDFKLHVGVLVEDFDAKVKLISEQHLSIMRVLENHTVRLRAIEERLVEIELRLGRVEDQMKHKVDYEDFRALEKKVALLESRLRQRA